jgi:hypothetical protein
MQKIDRKEITDTKLRVQYNNQVFTRYTLSRENEKEQKEIIKQRKDEEKCK